MPDAGAFEGDAPTARELQPPASVAVPGAVWLALSLAVGIAIAWHAAPPSPRLWLFAAAGASAAALAARRFAPSISFIGLCLAMLLLGAAWMTLRSAWLSPDDIAAHIGNERELVRLRGVVLNTPELRQRRAGSLAPFDYRQPATYFRLRVVGLLDRQRTLHHATGQVLVRVDETIVPLKTGDTIDAMGYLLRAIGPHNPGEFDYERYARMLGQAGMLTVPSRELISIAEPHHAGIVDRFVAVRENLRQRCGSWLLTNLPIADQPQRDALLSALLLGEREPALDGLMESFQHLGLAHLLAISGMHLAILAGFVLIAARFAGRHGRWHGWLIIGVVLAYLFLVEARAPVLRAGLMSIAASLGLAFGRRLNIGSLLALSAIVLLLWRPQELFTAGFQLSYGVVLGLVLFTRGTQQRWFRQRRSEAVTAAQMLGQWLRSALTVAVVAWLLATPLVMRHFGFLSPLGIPLSLLALPLVSGILLLGYARIVASLVLPSFAALLGVPLVILTDLMISMVRVFETVPLSSVVVPQPSMWWTIAALAWVCAWLGTQSRRWRRAIAWCVVPITVWAAWPALAPPTHAALRIDMLSVGDGSCYLLRSGRSAVVFDAGSSSSFDAGKRTIVPALRALRVRNIDAVVISHANLDHYSGVLELVDAFDVDEVLVSPQLMRQGETANPGRDPVAFLIDRLTAKDVLVRTVSAGDQATFDEMTWTWLHPRAGDRFVAVNNTSMIVRIAVATRSVLLTGDIQGEAIDAALVRHPDLHADVSELPHHGSANEDAMRFIKRIDPDVVMQSTGWTRWRSDKWAQALEGRERLVTARDGACWIEIDHDGGITFGRFRQWLDAPKPEDDRWE